MTAARQSVDVQTLVYQRMQPWQRLQAACELYWFAREIIKNRERRNHPEFTEEELEERTRALFQ